MADKPFNILLIILIGVPAIALLSMVGIRHMPLNELIITVTIGSAGILWVLIRALSLRSLTEKTETKTETNKYAKHN